VNSLFLVRGDFRHATAIAARNERVCTPGGKSASHDRTTPDEGVKGLRIPQIVPHRVSPDA
jgi:hypothetical protein